MQSLIAGLLAVVFPVLVLISPPAGQARDQTVPGKKLVIKNKLPDDESKNKIVFQSKDPSIEAGVRGSHEDPTCDGEGGGGGSASFSCNTSGQSHTSPLPCQNWSVIGKDPGIGGTPKGYKYKDKELDDGTCKSVQIKDQTLVKAICQGKGSTELKYDLQEGISQEPVDVVITAGSGSRRYCASFGGAVKKDGTDGKTYQARDAGAPSACSGKQVVSETVGAGGTVTTDADGDGATPSDPVETTVTTPNAGTVTIITGSIFPGPPAGFELIGQEIRLTVPDASPGMPFLLVFELDSSIIPMGVDENEVETFRDGVEVPSCSGAMGTADPDPCVSGRARLGNSNVELTVLSSTASDWNFGVPLLGCGDTVPECKGVCPAGETCVSLGPQTCACFPVPCGNIADPACNGTCPAGETCLNVPPIHICGCFPVRFVDNGDGTITDNETGLMWEKKDDAAGLHDVDTTYTWAGCCDGDCSSGGNLRQPTNLAATACAAQTPGLVGCRRCDVGVCDVDPHGRGATATIWQWLVALNQTALGGFADWRIPQVNRDGGAKELELLIDQRQTPPVVFSEFKDPCTIGCTSRSCSCTAAHPFYWSSTTDAGLLFDAWAVGFTSSNIPKINGFVTVSGKDFDLHVRAVRGSP